MKIVKRVMWLMSVTVGLSGLSVHAASPQNIVSEPDSLERFDIKTLDLEEISATPGVSEKLLRERFAKLQKEIPLTYHATSHQFVEYFMYKKVAFTRSMMEKMPLYFPIFEKALQKYGLPVELKYLSMIESGLNPRVISYASAGGLWQFMPATGREFGLYQDRHIDERFDPVKSTDAACRYLSQLYRIFGDWEMALASYNTGPGNVKRAMRRSRGNTFWTIYSALPQQTRSYVPQFVAMTYMMNFGHDHGIFPEKPEVPYPMDTIHISGYVDLTKFCLLTNVTMEEIQRLNPQITGTILPTNVKNFILRIPSEKFEYLASNRNTILDSSGRTFLTNTVLAVVDSSKIDSLRAAGALALSEEESSDVDLSDEGSVQAVATIAKKTKQIHLVKKGETLSSISRKYKVNMTELKSWNHLRKSTVMKGQKLVIYRKVVEPAKNTRVAANVAPAPQNKTTKIKMRYHTVQNGDTLWNISQQYGLTVDRIKKANRIKGNDIKPGMRLIISG
jgi:membrane-bound lytic murein transglycosylase D